MKPTAYGWTLLSAALTLVCAAAVPIHRAALRAETDLLLQSPQGPEAVSTFPPQTAPWKKTKATFYGAPYSDPKRTFHCADGTRYTVDGMFCATRLVPLGTMIEVKRGKVVLRLRVRDTQAKRFGHLIDLPDKTWDLFKAKRSVGMLPVEWRVCK